MVIVFDLVEVHIERSCRKMGKSQWGLRKKSKKCALQIL